MTEEELKAIAERCKRDDEKWGGVGLSYPDVFQMMGDRRHLLAEIARLRDRVTDERYSLIQIASAADVWGNEAHTAHEIEVRVIEAIARLRAALAERRAALWHGGQNVPIEYRWEGM